MANGTKYIIIYDIPREQKVLQVQINRKLHRINAHKIQHSTWESEDLDGLKTIARTIKASGGVANILEKKIIF